MPLHLQKLLAVCLSHISRTWPTLVVFFKFSSAEAPGSSAAATSLRAPELDAWAQIIAADTLATQAEAEAARQQALARQRALKEELDRQTQAAEAARRAQIEEEKRFAEEAAARAREAEAKEKEMQVGPCTTPDAHRWG